MKVFGATLVTMVATVMFTTGCGQEVHATQRVEATPAGQLAAVRAANQRYLYAANAILDGYYPSGDCLDTAQGAMGQHYVNQRYSGRIDSLHPPELFYAPVAGTGRSRVPRRRKSGEGCSGALWPPLRRSDAGPCPGPA